MKFEFFLTDIDYFDIGEKDYIRLWGRSGNKIVCLLDNCEKYYYHFFKPGLSKAQLEKYIEKIKAISFSYAGRQVKVKDAKVVKKNFIGKPTEALQIFAYNHKDIIPLKDKIKKFSESIEHAHKEDDINFITRYIIEKDITPLCWYNVEIEDIGKSSIDGINADIVGFVKSIAKDAKRYEYKPKILTFDIEASEFEIGKGEIIMISLMSDNFKKVLTWKKFPTTQRWIEFVKDEAELIKKFVDIVNSEKPDYLVGYFSDGFDMPYLKERAKANKIKLCIGLDGSEVSLQKGKITSAKTAGICHIDLFRFVENFVAPSLRTETLTLNEVASQLIGEKKLEVDFGILKDKESRQEGKQHSELEKFALYNLQDSILVYKLFHKLWPQMFELTKIVKEPLFNVTRSSFSQLVESYIIHGLKQFNEIAEHRPFQDVIAKRKLMPKYTGAFVLEPKPGLYDGLAVFDFRSLYPSIIISYNISPASITTKKTSLATPEFELDRKKVQFYFDEKPTFIPLLLKELVEMRKKVKQEKKLHPSPLLEARDLALKTLANAHYGYFGFFGARYYSRECAASITALGRWHIAQTIEKAKKAGFDVIYADTDSLAILLKDKSKTYALEWLKKVNAELPKGMELELEDFYKRAIFVTTRKGEIGAKKKYAMISEKGELKIRGFETVRRDWCELAKEVQNKVLLSVLEEAKPDKALNYVREIIKKLKNKQIELDKLVIRTQIKKEIEAYAAYTPHVEIARRMQQRGIPVRPGSLAEWIVCESKEKKARIREKVKMPDEVKDKEYDSDYYINNQIIPAVESIFNVFNIKSEEIIEGKKQKKLEF
ncbi:MAG: DNA-directed DNA polymerase [Candidatus Pacearchaeota archaeon]